VYQRTCSWRRHRPVGGRSGHPRYHLVMDGYALSSAWPSAMPNARSLANHAASQSRTLV